jgi:hypothetical protein
MLAYSSAPTKAVLVNRLPWSALKISGLPNRASASSAVTQNDVHRIGLSPARHGAASPVPHRQQMEKAAADGSVVDVRRPHLVRRVDPPAAQQIYEYPVPRRRRARLRLRSHSCDAIKRISRWARLRLTEGPSRRSIRDIRREARKGHVVNSRRSNAGARSLSFASAPVRYTLERATREAGTAGGSTASGARGRAGLCGPGRSSSGPPG